MNRRAFLQSATRVAAASSLGALGLGYALRSDAAERRFVPTRKDAVKLSEEEWRKRLTKQEYKILRKGGTERAFKGDLWDHKGDGVYTCAGCALPLFDSKTKFKSGTGWPSYYQPIAEDAVAEVEDLSYGMKRVEVVCARCGGHLGHVFRDGPKPTGLRYCVNSAALDFAPRGEAPKKKGPRKRAKDKKS